MVAWLSASFSLWGTHSLLLSYSLQWPMRIRYQVCTEDCHVKGFVTVPCSYPEVISLDHGSLKGLMVSSSAKASAMNFTLTTATF